MTDYIIHCVNNAFKTITIATQKGRNAVQTNITFYRTLIDNLFLCRDVDEIAATTYMHSLPHTFTINAQHVSLIFISPRFN